MNEELLRNISAAIFNFSGLQVLESQYLSLNSFLQKKAEEFNSPFDDFCENLLKSVKDETSELLMNKNNVSSAFYATSAENKTERETRKKILSDVINFITVNETYFFREEKQFDFLKNVVFPKYSGKKINIWSAACATGEEPLSILALAESCGLSATVFATDIDNLVLQKFKEGKYANNSFRKDGAKYHRLLQPFFTKNELFYSFDKDFVNKIQIAQHNLTSEKNPFANFFGKMDVIFIRNVFIYFNVETRKKVLRFLSSQLKQDGVLLFSVSEVASIDDYIIPDGFEKKHYQGVYYFRHRVQDDFSENAESYEKQNILSTVTADESANPLYFGNENFQKIKTLSKNSDDNTNGADKKNYAVKQNYQNPRAFDSPPIQKKETKNAALLKPISSVSAVSSSSVSTLSSSSSSIEQIFSDVCDCINNRDFENAKKLAFKINLELQSDQKKYLFYTLAYVAYQNDEKTEAEKLFAAAETAGNDFWPAYFYHGLVLKDIGKDEKASVCFKKCLEILELKSNSCEYNFLIDSFSPSYIYSLCYKFQKDAKGRKNEN